MNTQKQKAIAPQSCGGDDRLSQTSSSHSSPSSKAFQRSGSNHPCPICGRTKDSDCSWNDEVYFCHT
ncbi:MAG: hypothetical protein VKJ64_04250, partial [Leptolyngbyaceae bacterium]|nr:hypothetical protein [Leptolyngbyaceae bacterium]